MVGSDSPDASASARWSIPSNARAALSCAAVIMLLTSVMMCEPSPFNGRPSIRFVQVEWSPALARLSDLLRYPLPDAGRGGGTAALDRVSSAASGAPVGDGAKSGQKIPRLSPTQVLMLNRLMRGDVQSGLRQLHGREGFRRSRADRCRAPQHASHHATRLPDGAIVSEQSCRPSPVRVSTEFALGAGIRTRWGRIVKDSDTRR